MDRLHQYFSTAQGCTPDKRQVGIEVETLFGHVDSSGRVLRPISRKHSQRMLRALVDQGWTLVEKRAGTITCISRDGFSIVFELGWSNFELNTPPAPVSHTSDLFGETMHWLEEIERVTKTNDDSVIALTQHCDGCLDMDTLVMPDPRDQIWLDLDGWVLRVLGHIACVQFTVDVVSVEEAFEFIRALQPLRQEQTWPAPDSAAIWRQYVRESNAGYEPIRYGPAPQTFREYCEALAGMKVVMDKPNGHLVRRDPALPFSQAPAEDMDLFLRSVWWWCRLRVRNGKLMLEIRDIPRSTNEDILCSWNLLKTCLGL